MSVLPAPQPHARLSASAAERWTNCPGSVNLVSTLPSTPSQPAAEGTLAHSIAAWCLTDGTTPDKYLGKTIEVEGFKFTVDQEMIDGIVLYLETIIKLKLESSRHEVALTDVLSKWDEDLGGTADFATYSPARKLLRVIDFKYGAGVFVSADDNKQLKTYALGALLAVNAPVDLVEVYIVQPRFEGAEPVRMQAFPAFDLIEFAGELAEAAKATRAPDAPLIAGPWCKKTFCPAARVCPALERMQHALVESTFSAVVPFDAKRLADALAAIPLVEARIKAINEFAYERATAGDAIPGYKLVEKRARRHWTNEDAVIEWAKARAIEPFEKPELKSPAQLEKGLKKPEKAELAAFTASVSSGTSLVVEADPRPAVSRQVTVDNFVAIGGPDVAPKQLSAENLFS